MFPSISKCPPFVLWKSSFHGLKKENQKQHPEVLSRLNVFCLLGGNIDNCVAMFTAKFHKAFNQSKDSVVLAHSNTFAGFEFGSPLRTMMLPGMTDSPPNFFTPRRLPPRFFCEC